MKLRLSLAAACVAGVLAPSWACARTLDEAIDLALAHAPALKRVVAERDAAGARIDQARAERMPSVTASAGAATGTADLGGFFGFGQQSVSPRSAQLSLQQPLYTSGAVSAAIRQAEAGGDAATAAVQGARLSLAAETASAYVDVLTAEQTAALQTAHLDVLSRLVEQTGLRFEAGEIARTDVAQAQMRRAAARAALARAQGDLAVARARYRSLTGEEPLGLEPPTARAGARPTLEQALAQAAAKAAPIGAARSALRAAEEGVRRARAAGGPTAALTAQASTVRDEFLPGYRSDGATVGVQLRWPLFTGGRVSAKVAEAQAQRRAAQAALDAAAAEVEQAAVQAWQGWMTADAVAAAAAEQVAAAESALYSVENEVRVGQKPTLDLLDAQRDRLAAQVARLQADGAVTVAAYRLAAVIGG